MKKSGFTLMELMVYIAILGVVVLIAGQAFSNSTKIRVRTESMIKANEEAERIGAIIQDDIAQTGAKTAKETRTFIYDASARDSFYVSDSVYINAATSDYSSFERIQQNNNDKFTMRRMRYDDKGSFLSVEEVVWFVKNKKLFRTCRTLEEKQSVADECPKNGNTVEIVDNVAEFKIIPAEPSVLNGNSSKIFPSTDISAKEFRLIPRKKDSLFVPTINPQKGGVSVTLSNFAGNYNKEDQKIDDTKFANQLYAAAGTDDASFSETSWTSNCTRITLNAHTEYELYFKVPYVMNKGAKSFCPGVDHMAVGFRNSSDGSFVSGLHDFAFYPPVDLNANDERRFRFSTDSIKANVCIVFTLSMFTPAVLNSSISIANLGLSKVEESDYVFDESFYPTNSIDKQNVKAFKVKLTINRNGESGVVSLVVPTPSNGKAK